jgi:hypothetical protein
MTHMAPDFLLIPYALIVDPRITPVDQRVYAVVYWYTKLKLERCIAANKTIAKFAATTPHMVQKSLSNLEKSGYIRRTYSDEAKRSREEIHPLLVFGVSPSGHGGYHPQVTGVSPTGDQKKNTEVEDIKENKSLAPAEADAEGKAIAEVINLFQAINPAYQKFFYNKTQRAAAQRLLTMHDLEFWRKFMNGYAKVFPNRYCPKAVTPVQLEDNLARIMAYGHALKAGEGKYEVGRV